MTDPKTPAQITETERALLRFPGSVPGVLRRGSPCLSPDGERHVAIEPATAGRWYVGTVYSDGGWGGNRLRADTLGLDLTDATGRAHLAWWVADRTLDRTRPNHGGEGVFWWSPEPQEFRGRKIPGEARWLLGDRFFGVYGMTFVGDPQKVNRVGASGHHPDEDPEGDIPDPYYRLVPSLSTLDPDDPRLLPDGSRLIDALALSLVARHVAGLDKEPSC